MLRCAAVILLLALGGGETFEFTYVGDDGFAVALQGIQLLYHTPETPIVSFVAHSTTFEEYSGNWLVNDTISERVALVDWSIQEENGVTVVDLFNEDQPADVVRLSFNSADSTMTSESMSTTFSALTLNLFAEEDERVVGVGEQFTYLNLRGRAFPVWVREGGVGRGGPISPIVNATVPGGAGDYHTTYFPSLFYASSRGVVTRSKKRGIDYTVLDFSSPDYHEVYSFTTDLSLTFTTSASGSIKEALMAVWAEDAANKWRQGVPDWVSDGMIISVQKGTDRMVEIAERCVNAGIPVAGMWIQDWAGQVDTPLGYRVFWNWQWNETMYPALDTTIQDLLSTYGIRVTAYINPYLNIEGNIFSEASQSRYLLRNAEGQDYVQDHGGFAAGTVNLLDPAAKRWYKNLIVENMVNLGLAGWMADFGEYTPVDGDTGMEGRVYHQLFPSLWAEASGEVLLENGLEDDILIWMRSGLEAGGAALQPTIWAGDQNVDFTIEDGLPSAITGALSAGLNGIGIYHWDIGGYTTFNIALERSRELLIRSAEVAMFSPVLRSHEGNSPDDNVQVYDEDVLEDMARIGQIFVEQKPYTQRLVSEYLSTGYPLMRPLFLEFPEYTPAWNVPYQYMYGESLMITPVISRFATTKDVHLPPGTWEDLWTGDQYEGPQDTVTFQSELGYPPVLINMDVVSLEDYVVFSGIRQRHGRRRP